MTATKSEKFFGVFVSKICLFQSVLGDPDPDVLGLPDPDPLVRCMDPDPTLIKIEQTE